MVPVRLPRNTHPATRKGQLQQPLPEASPQSKGRHPRGPPAPHCQDLQSPPHRLVASRAPAPAINVAASPGSESPSGPVPCRLPSVSGTPGKQCIKAGRTVNLNFLETLSGTSGSQFNSFKKPIEKPIENPFEIPPAAAVAATPLTFDSIGFSFGFSTGYFLY